MLVETREQFEQAMGVLLFADKIAFDTETRTITKEKDPTIVGFSTYCEIPGRPGNFISFYFPWNHAHDREFFNGENLPWEWFQEAITFLEREDVIFFMHNLKFDLEVLFQNLITVKAPVLDTMLLAHMVNENEWNFGLKPLAKKYIGHDSTEEQQLIKSLLKLAPVNKEWDRLPPHTMAEYACKDAELTWQLFHLLWPKILEEELNIKHKLCGDGEEVTLVDREMEFARCLMRMERTGIGIDDQLAKQLSEATGKRLQVLHEALGYDPMKPSQLASRLFQAPPVGLGFVPKEFSQVTSKSFPQGRPKMGREILKSLDHPEVATVLEYRSLVKAKSTWFDGFVEKLGPDGRLHPNYKQHGTVTRRLSCSQPNLQQIPRSEGAVNLDSDNDFEGLSNSLVLSLFEPLSGYRLIQFDYSQIEFRLAACYAKEESILEAYRQGSDMHQLTADLLGIDRHSGKTINFATLYGAGPAKIGQMLGYETYIEVDSNGKEKLRCPQSETLLQNFWGQYPNLQQMVMNCDMAARQRGWVRYWTGRRRHFTFANESHKAFNSVIQGGAAEIMVDTMLALYKMHSDLRMLVTVHDALWFEIRNETLDADCKRIQTAMEWPEQKFGIPFPVEMKVLNDGNKGLKPPVFV